MTRVALIDSGGLLGKELRELLGRGLAGQDERVRLFTTNPDDAGTLGEVGDAAALVSLLEPGDLGGYDLAFDCGDEDDRRPEAGARLTIVLPPSGLSSSGRAMVAGVNDGTIDEETMVVSPGAGVIACALVTTALAEAAPERLAATVLEPVSIYGQEGIDELLEQARALLAFTEPPTGRLGRRLAFNLNSRSTDSAGYETALGNLVGERTEVAVQRLQSGSFHGVGVALQIGFARPLAAEEASQLLSDHPLIEIAEEPEIGLADVAGSTSLLVGAVRNAGGSDSSLTVWACLDNLTRGGALNALELARRRFPDL